MQGSRFICRQESVQPSVLAPPGAGSSPGFGTLPFERAPGPRCGGVSGTRCLQASRGHSCCSLQAAPSSARFHADTASIQQLSILTEAEQHHCITPGSGKRRRCPRAPRHLGSSCTLSVPPAARGGRAPEGAGGAGRGGHSVALLAPNTNLPFMNGLMGLRTPELHLWQSCSQQGPPGDHRVNGRGLNMRQGAHRCLPLAHGHHIIPTFIF